MIIGASPVYYDLTYRFVSRLNDAGLEKMSSNTDIPLELLKKFSKDRKVRGMNKYVTQLYFHLFQNMTPLQATLRLREDGL